MFAGRGIFAARWWRARRHARHDDAGSMPVALLVTLVGVTLSASLTSQVVGQLKESQRAADRTAAVAAAQAGLDAGLAKIRASVNGLAGDVTKLPCTAFTSTLTALSGTSSSTPPKADVSIGYFLVDPSSMIGALTPIGDLSNITPITTGGISVNALLASLGQSVTSTTSLTDALSSAIGCVSGALAQVPLYGLLRSSGTVGRTTRTLYATYTFHTPEETIPGGRVIIAGNGSIYCLGDANASPVAGDPVKAVLCTSADKQAQFIYPKNLSLSLSLSRSTTSYPYGLCITAASQATDVAAVFQACAATKSSTQQWSYDVNAQTYYGTSNGTSSSGFCLNVKTPGQALSPIVLKTGGSYCGSAGVTGKAMVPDPDVGAGAAGTNTGQLVNYQEVGRCLDLTNEDVTGADFISKGLARALITYPCKQTFSGSVYWNHKWTGPTIASGGYQATGQIYTVPASGTYANKPYCLNSPGASGGYVWVADCATGGAALQWTVYDAAPLAAEAYRITDQYGHCLEAAGSLGAAYRYSTWSEVIATTCDGSGIQKWNVPASFGAGPLKGMQEK
jgi:hypothetical protein